MITVGVVHSLTLGPIPNADLALFQPRVYGWQFVSQHEASIYYYPVVTELPFGAAVAIQLSLDFSSITPFVQCKYDTIHLCR